MPPNNLYIIDQLSVSYHCTQVLKALSLELASGQWICLVGPNGAGKSTLVKTLAGLMPYQGSIQLNHLELSAWPRKERARYIAWLDQYETPSEDMSVFDIVLLGRIPHQSWAKLTRKIDRYAAEQALKQTKAWPWRHKTIRTLSAGERQRVLLARTLAVQGRLLILDEPFTNLDPPHQVESILLIKKLVALGCTVITVVHDISQALYADQLLIMEHGQIRHQGASDDPASHQALEEVFMNRIRIRHHHNHWLAIANIEPNSKPKRD